MLSLNNELINAKVFKNKTIGSDYVCELIRSEICENDKSSKKTVLGLATGASPKLIYKRLVHLYQKGEVSFKNVHTFNLDEYYPIQPSDPNSYHHYMDEHLFNHVDIPPKHINIPNGTIDQNEIETYCTSYDERISNLGGIDIQMLGVGRNGHIGFNEPGSKLGSKTRLVTLDKKTRVDAAEKFSGINHTPRQAITMGVSTILRAKKIICFAWGAKKAFAVSQLFNNGVTQDYPITFLKEHSNVELVLDKGAASLIDSKIL